MINTARKRTATGRCPSCGLPTRPEVRPFCSKRCRNQDLVKWLDGSYSVAVVEEPGGDTADFSRDEGR